MKTHHYVNIEGEPQPVTVESTDGRRYLVRIGETELTLEAHAVAARQYELLDAQGRVHDVLVAGTGGEVVVHHRQGSVPVEILDETALARRALSGGQGGLRAKGELVIEAPMPGRVVKRLAAPGDVVKEGQGLIVVEAMKMENELRSPVDGTIKAVEVDEGADVEAGATLVVIDASSEG